jgi:hypothetical protein
VTDRATGQELRVVTSRVLEDDPAKAGISAFCIRGGKLVPLREQGGDTATESQFLGTIGGRTPPAGPMPVITNAEMY